MRLYQLFEDAQQDRTYRQVANELLTSLKQELDVNGFANFGPVRVGGKQGKRINSVRLGIDLEKPLTIIFVENWRGERGVESLGAYASKIDTVFIFLDPYNREGGLDAWDRRDWYTVFIHEVIHHLDNTRIQDMEAITRQADDSYYDYVNSSLEFNAMYQQALDEAEKSIAMFKESDSYARIYELLLNDVEKFTKFVMAKLPSEITSTLNDKYRRKFMKRLAQYYSTFKHEIEPS